ncbi:sugar kinase [Altererythrobacter sediminis]|uniref:Sugar kinase n=2 Tax=Allopontixanthobacter sediminis TaxID=1689985 RepID=A0A845B1E1_9SPHN|nr:sugar kinase [Allopontixanthobacter sediminis]
MLEYHSGGSSGGLRYGGDTLNTAIHLARMGHDVAYVTAVGSDPISDALVAGWAAEGIDTRFVLRHPDRNPGIYAIHVDVTGERSFLYWRDQSAAREMFGQPGMADALAHTVKCDFIYYSLITLAILPESARLTLLEAACAVREAGGNVAYDSNFRMRLWPTREAAWQSSQGAIACASIGLPTNSDECEIAGTALTEQEIATNWLDQGCFEVVVKAGERGCLLARRDSEMQTIPVNRLIMVDASGAGDAFNAGYLSARIEGLDPEQAAARGQRLAGWVIRRHGAVPPIDDDLRQLLADFRA